MRIGDILKGKKAKGYFSLWLFIIKNKKGKNATSQDDMGTFRLSSKIYSRFVEVKPMEIIVQKFGGTSLATKEKMEMAAKKVIDAKKEGYDVVVVVSAMGRKGAPYATDTLLNLIQEANQNASPREVDLLLHCGEIISSVVFSQILTSKGYESLALTGAQAGIITDKSFSEARILKIKPDKIKKHLKEGRIVVVTGFQGATEDGELTTLGRGGSDTTATALGVALDAKYVEIFTDVDGIKTADPRIVDNAKTLETVTYSEICQLAHQGAKVIHPRAVEIAMQKDIPIKIRSTFSDTPGTLVTNCRENGQTVDIFAYRIITGITHMGDLSQIRINMHEQKDSSKMQLNILKTIAASKISIDFINISPQEIVFTVAGKNTTKVESILSEMNIKANITRGCAMVSIVGVNMMGVPGVMADSVEALVEKDIQILQTADSYTTVWYLVKEQDIEKAIIALHNKFELGN